MSIYVSPIANGTRTDHPVPGLPFVDDSHIPIEDPDAVEAIGRHDGGGTWGRCDADTTTGEWIAFTTDPKNPSVGWVVRYHPELGRSVLLYRDEDDIAAYDDWFGDKPLLARLGGYWWTGTDWYRPRQVMDWASEQYVRRAVQYPTVISAADLLDGTEDADLGRQVRIMQLGSEPGSVELAGHQLQGNVGAGGHWRNELAMWAARRSANALPLDKCIVTLTAPELFAGALLGVEEFSTQAGIAASTLRAYIARDEASVPPPQAIEGPRKKWAAPVVTDWIEQRRRDPATAAAVLSVSIEEGAQSEDSQDSLPPGLKTLWSRLTEMMLRELWGDAPSRRRWSRPFRNEAAVRNVATRLGWQAALQLDSTLPTQALIAIIEDSVELQLRDYEDGDKRVPFDLPVGRMLGWFIEHRPTRAQALFGAIIGQAERNMIPRSVTVRSLRGSIALDGGFDDKDRLREFLELALPPER